MILILSTIALQAVTPSPVEDSARYASAAVQRIVTLASERNHRVPAGLSGYRSRVESEISIGSLRREGQEAAFTIEQVASDLTWDRSGSFEQHVIGYRVQQAGFTVATLGLFRDAWVVPSLYGNRLALLFGRDSSVGRSRATGADGRTVFAVHPFADDRETFYRYRGGDTVLTIGVGERRIPIVRVIVEPAPGLRTTAVLFTGEVDVDAERHHIVRMRGAFARVGEPSLGLTSFIDLRLQGIANVELVNAEIDGAWWLPSEQRFELHATTVAAAESRAVFRILTRFGAFDIVVDSSAPRIADTLRAVPHRLSVATNDTLSQFRAWRSDLGTETSAVSARDFDDIAPNFLRATGAPIVLAQAERFGDYLHANRIEGPFTGAGVTLRLRDAAPGLLLRAVAGYAWIERTARGRLIAEWQRGGTLVGVRVGRGLDITKDFRSSLDSGAGPLGLFGVDRDHYVDRRSATLQLARSLGDRYGSAVRVDAGLVDDGPATARWAGPVRRWTADRLDQNNSVTPGRYMRSAATIDWRPDVSPEFLRTGVGARLHVERGAGDVAYVRVESRVAVRLNRGPLTLALRADAGVVRGATPPPQQLFELGNLQGLPGYADNAFAGTRAALARASAWWRLPLLHAPIRVSRRWWLPAPAPALAWSIHAGMTDAPTAGGQIAVARLRPPCGTASSAIACGSPARVSDGWRASTGVGLRLFGGALGVVAAKPLDGRGWRGLVVAGY